MEGIPFLVRVDPWLVRVLINRLLGVPPFNECTRPLGVCVCNVGAE